jgi:hypothetical protein
MYTLTMRCEDGGDETLTVQAQDLDDARVIARDAVEDWVRDGAWGPEGTTVRAWWRLHDAEGEEVASGDLTVTIDPDHQTLIRDAVGPYNEAVCGLDPSDHDWTSVGEGGCAENPGVWSPGGTTLVFRSHCRRCGLMRIEQIAGSRRQRHHQIRDGRRGHTLTVARDRRDGAGRERRRP